MRRKAVPRRERVTAGPNIGHERRRHRVATQLAPKASGQGAAAIERALSGVW
ncbi:hypothetical protein F9U42_01435 [Pectobacterium versatile]|uniref:hypothetical protein n=1 Tax=Pectobacterium versatile TaxID=2488639 RepID=UPI001B399D45|nr:hypothetical protein [Pectobacterium versatile]MBQ4765793.1 hypothetical protein [Pectobacterium versatile]